MPHYTEFLGPLSPLTADSLGSCVILPLLALRQEQEAEAGGGRENPETLAVTAEVGAVGRAASGPEAQGLPCKPTCGPPSHQLDSPVIMYQKFSCFPACHVFC